MKTGQSDPLGEPLSPNERARLRREVDADALDRVLTKAPAAMRAALIAACVERVTNADLITLGFDPLDEDMLQRGSMDVQFEPKSELQRLWEAARPVR
jgi:hypothetical protein